MKICRKCKVEYADSLASFNKDSQRKDGLAGICRGCAKEKSKTAYAAKKPAGEFVKTQKEWAATGLKRCPRCTLLKKACADNFNRCAKRVWAGWCKACERARPSAQRKTRVRFIDATHRECTKCSEVKIYAEFPPNKKSPWGISCYCRKCTGIANKSSHEKYREARNESARSRLSRDPALHMKYRILGLVRKAIDRHALAYPVSSVTREFWQVVGYTRAELAEHLEQQFLPGMSWENRKLWHIDHIVPVSYFKPTSFSDPKFLACWGLNNLRPMWAADNIRKRDSLEFLHLLE